MIRKEVPNKRKGIPIFYLLLYENIKRNSSELIIKKKDVCSYFHHYRIPKVMRFDILDEMIKFGLFENKGKQVKIK